ncbi:myosin-1 [Setaria italica]|uniref:myosin-1 n=1 Tax=Setaria italica TaxID=4555 RepID=UPI000648770A|nr:myosin-1 [Setaria italica]
MTPLSPSEQERHRETASPVPNAPPPPPQGSGPSKTQRPAVATAMMPGGGGTERAREGRLAGAVSWMAALLLAAVVAGRDAAVPRKKRGPRVRAETSRWWSFRLPVPPPPATPRAGTCGDCGVTKTSQWRTGPMGPRTLCNTCGRRRWAAGEQWGEPRRRRRATTPTTVSDQPPPPPPDGPVWEGPLPEGYRTARRNAAKGSSPSPAPATATTDSDKPAPQNKKKNKRRLLPEYRPQASPTFDKENHASMHSEVLELRQQSKNKQKQQQPPALAQPQPMDDTQQDVDHLMPPPLPRCVANDLRVGATDGDSANKASGSGAAVASTDPVGEASSLDPFLLDGPAAPMVVDEPCWMIAGSSTP